jgi:hypothetical protein
MTVVKGIKRSGLSPGLSRVAILADKTNTLSSHLQILPLSHFCSAPYHSLYQYLCPAPFFVVLCGLISNPSSSRSLTTYTAVFLALSRTPSRTPSLCIVMSAFKRSMTSRVRPSGKRWQARDSKGFYGTFDSAYEAACALADAHGRPRPANIEKKLPLLRWASLLFSWLPLLLRCRSPDISVRRC